VFLFLSFYVINKFIVIFFFKAAFLPRFLFDLTPFHWFVGFDDTQLLALSSIVVLGNMIFHISIRRRYLLYSLFLTVMLVSGIGLAIASSPFSMDYLLHYGIFFILLTCLLLDYRLVLMLPASELSGFQSRRSPMTKHGIDETMPAPVHAHPRFPAEPAKPHPLAASLSSALSHVLHTLSRVIGIHKPTIPISSSSMPEPDKENDITDMPPKEMISDVGNDISHIGHLNHLINKIRIDTSELTEEYFTTMKNRYLQSDFSPPIIETNMSEEKKRKAYQHLVDSIDEQAVIINRGVIKAVSCSFAQMLGYNPFELVGRNFLHLLAMDSIPVYRRNVLSRLQGDSLSVQSLILVSKYHEKHVLQVSTRTLKIIEGTAELLVFQSAAA
jgi:PAS domain S-box-containing protein